MKWGLVKWHLHISHMLELAFWCQSEKTRCHGNNSHTGRGGTPKVKVPKLGLFFNCLNTFTWLSIGNSLQCTQRCQLAWNQDILHILLIIRCFSSRTLHLRCQLISLVHKELQIMTPLKVLSTKKLKYPNWGPQSYFKKCGNQFKTVRTSLVINKFSSKCIQV